MNERMKESGTYREIHTDVYLFRDKTCMQTSYIFAHWKEKQNTKFIKFAFCKKFIRLL